MKPPRSFFIICIALSLAGGLTLHAQGTAFSYQGRLNDGTNPAAGSYDMTFALFSVSNGVGQVGATLTNAATPVSSGLFAVTLDFGANFPGAARWLEIGVRTNGGSGYTTLTPRQKFTAVPYAITAGYAGSASTATTATSLSGTLPVAQLSGNLPTSQLAGTLLPAQFAGIYSNAVTLNNPANSFTGNGTALTNVNAVTVRGLGTNSFWQTGGNSGVSPAGGNFLGTLDNQPLEFRVNNARALRLETTTGAPNVIGGASNNIATAGVIGAVIGGGSGNTNGGNYSTVPGGISNYALGDFSFAGGQRAKALNTGAFVWADSQNADFSSTASNQFNIRAGGGVRIVTAVGTNAPGMTLDGLPVLVGSGVGVLAWQTVAGTSFQATNHYGYALTNSQSVTMTLPTGMNVGDTIAVSGGGSGGWKIAQNANQSVLAGNFTLVNNPAPTWSLASSTSPRNWQALAASADGSRLVAVVTGGQIYTSADSGATWTARDSNRSWMAVASSADGSKLVAVANGGIYTSTDFGVSWTFRVAGNWRCVASSADGTKLVAGLASGNIFTSTDSGANWTSTSGTSGNWLALASSGDGTVLLAGYAIGSIYFSIDSGVTWSTYSSSLNCTAVAVAADGGKLVAVVNTGNIYISSDAGNNWVTTGAPFTNWTSLAASADGTKLAAGVANGPIFISNNGGVTWRTASAPTANWSALASSADGGKLSGSVYAGGIYNSRPAAQRTTTVGTTGFLSGGQNSAVQLQYIGNNQFIPISHEGTIFAY